jgi:hypothetical protein
MKELNINEYLNSPFELFSFVNKLQNIVAKSVGAKYTVDEEKMKKYHVAHNLDVLYMPKMYYVLFGVFIFIALFVFQMYLRIHPIIIAFVSLSLITVGYYFFNLNIRYYTHIPKIYIYIYGGISLIVSLTSFYGFFNKYFNK